MFVPKSVKIFSSLFRASLESKVPSGLEDKLYTLSLAESVKIEVVNLLWFPGEYLVFPIQPLTSAANLLK